MAESKKCAYSYWPSSANGRMQWGHLAGRFVVFPVELLLIQLLSHVLDIQLLRAFAEVVVLLLLRRPLSRLSGLSGLSGLFRLLGLSGSEP